MGFFDGLTNIKNFFTGGGAEITVAIKGDCYLRKPFLASTVISVGDSDISSELVYLHLAYTEIVEATGTAHDMHGNSSRKTFRERTILYEKKFTLDENVILKAKETYYFETEINLPIEVFPSFKGINAELVWSLQTFIEKTGNDPESDKLVFEPTFEII